MGVVEAQPLGSEPDAVGPVEVLAHQHPGSFAAAPPGLFVDLEDEFVEDDGVVLGDDAGLLEADDLREVDVAAGDERALGGGSLGMRRKLALWRGMYCSRR